MNRSSRSMYHAQTLNVIKFIKAIMTLDKVGKNFFPVFFLTSNSNQPASDVFNIKTSEIWKERKGRLWTVLWIRNWNLFCSLT